MTNSDPRVIAQYYCDCIKQVRGAPRIVRTDPGTENCNVAGIRCFFRRNGSDSLAGEKSFMYGRSVSNQRIEAWWSFFRKTDSDCIAQNAATHPGLLRPFSREHLKAR